jgi:hypothetical protein
LLPWRYIDQGAQSFADPWPPRIMTLNDLEGVQLV